MYGRAPAPRRPGTPVLVGREHGAARANPREQPRRLGREMERGGRADGRLAGERHAGEADLRGEDAPASEAAGPGPVGVDAPARRRPRPR